MEHEPKQRDRNLLFAVLAVQLLRVPPGRLMEVAAAWAVDPSRDLADRLVDADLLTPEDRDLIWSLVDRAVEAHVGDVVAALETFGGAEQLDNTRTGSILVSDQGVRVVLPGTGPVKIELGDLPGVPETPGRYSGGSEFARGGMGRVFLVHDVYLGRDVALKELLPVRRKADTEPTPTPVRQAIQITARFLQEARITGQLEHPSIVPVYELGHRPDGSLYYTMKLVRGTTLAKSLEQATALTNRLGLLPHFVNLCQAIAYAHSRGVLHRDLKPSNVMLGEFGETVVIDWGLAKAKNQPDVHADPLSTALQLGRAGKPLDLERTQYGQVLGTPHYMAPEQAEGAIERVDERSDVYALGAILYEILTGNPPYRGKKPAEILEKVISELPPPIESVEPETPPEIVAICTRAITRNPERRYQTAKELADDIQRYLSGALVSAYRYRFSEHLRRYVRQHRTVLGAIAASLIALVSVGIYYNVHLYRARQTERALRIETQTANARLEWEYYSSALVEAKSNIDGLNGWKATQILQRLPERLRDWEWGRLLRESNPALFSIRDDPMRGMTGMPLRAVFGKDNRYVLVAHDFGGVKTIFDVVAGDTVYISEVDRFLGWPRCNGFTRDARAITLGEDDQNAVLFDYANDRVLARYTIESGWLCSLVLSPDEQRAAGYRFGPDSREREIVLWEASTGKEVRRFALAPATEVPLDLAFWGSMHFVPNGSVLGFLKDNRRLVYVDEQVGVLDTVTGEKTTITPCRSGNAVLAEDAERVVVLTPNGDLEVWSFDPPERVDEIEIMQYGIRDLAVTPDARYFGVAGLNKWTLCDLASGRELRTYVTDAAHIESLSFSPNARCAVSYGSESTLKFWDLRADRTQYTVPFPYEPVESGEDHINGNTWPNLPYAYDDAVSMLVRGDKAGGVRIWSVPSYELIHEWQAHDGIVTALTFSPDSKTLYTTSVEGTAKAWRIEDGSLLWSVSADDSEPVFSVGASPDGARVAIGFGEDSSVNNGVNPSRIVDTLTGETLLEIDDTARKTTLLAFTPDGREIVSGAWGRYGTEETCVHFFDANDGAVKPYTVKAIGWPYRVIAVPNSPYLLFLGSSREPLLWDLETDREVYRVLRYDVSQITVHPDGRRFVGKSRGHAVVFAIEDGRPLLSLDDCIGLMTFSADGQSLITRGPENQMLVFPAEDWTLVDEAQREAMGLDSLRALLER